MILYRKFLCIFLVASKRRTFSILYEGGRKVSFFFFLIYVTTNYLQQLIVIILHETKALFVNI